MEGNKKYVNKVNTLGKVNKRKEKIGKFSDTTEEKICFSQDNDIKIKLQLDTGSDINKIDEKTYRKLG